MQLVVSFANVEAVRKLELRAATGVRPQTWTLWASPQSTPIQPFGNLFLSDGTLSLTLTACQVLTQKLVYGVRGPLLRITGVDRRAYWQGQLVDGRYNVRTPDGQIQPGTERTPQQLASILWAAMGEPFALVGALPNDDRPEVYWDAANAATELDELCRRYGCTPTLDIGSNTAGIVVLGQGAVLPNNLDVRWVDEGINGVLPTRIEAASGFVLLESKLRLRAVLEDTDGVIRPADEVAYAPEGGWNGNVVDPEDPLLPGNPAFTEDNAERAKKLWRMWAVTGYADGTLTHPVLGPVNSVDELLPISDVLLAPADGADGESSQDAFLVGTALLDADPDEAVENTPDGSRIDVPFQVDAEQGIVTTSVPLAKVTNDGQLEEADLWIVCVHRMRDISTNQYVRYVRFFLPGGPGGVKGIRRFDIEPGIRLLYGTGASHTQVAGQQSNIAQVEDLLDAEIASALAHSQPLPTMTVEYNGIQPVSPDGAIRSMLVRLDCEQRPDEANCITIAYRNMEGGEVIYRAERQRQQSAVSVEIERGRERVRQRRSSRRRIRG